MYDKVKKEMTDYYRKMDMIEFLKFRDQETTDEFSAKYHRIFKEMDDYYKNNPKMPTVLY